MFNKPIINIIILLGGIWTLSWWNSHLVLKDIRKNRAAYIEQYNIDVANAKARAEQLSAIVASAEDHTRVMDDHTATMNKILAHVDESQGAWPYENHKTLIQVENELQTLLDIMKSWEQKNHSTN